MQDKYNVVIMATKKNLDMLRIMIPYCWKNLDAKAIYVVANENISDQVRNIDGVCYFDESKVYSGLTYDGIAEILKEIIGDGRRAGWYLQQFLKMAWCYIDEAEDYVVIDADTIPLNPILFKNNGEYLFTRKIECHKPYFETLNRLFNGKIYRKEDYSFIAEHMMFNSDYMAEIISSIEQNDSIKGNSFFEKILYSISPADIGYSGFSEFETYGNYMQIMHPDKVNIRRLRTQREAGVLLGNSPSKEQLLWAQKDYDIISIEDSDYKTTLAILLSKNKVFRKFVSMKTMAHVRSLVRNFYRRLIKKESYTYEEN